MSMCSSGIRKLLQLSVSRVAYSLNSRSLSLSSRLRDTFTVQDEADFKSKVVNSKKPVVVDFYATWCGPCKMLMPRLETVIVQCKDSVDLAKVDIDDNPEIAMEYGVGVVPTVLGFNGGKVIDKFVGVQEEDQIESFVKNLQKS